MAIQISQFHQKRAMAAEEPLIKARALAGDPHIAGPVLLLINPHEAHYAATVAKKKGGRNYSLFHCRLTALEQADKPSYWVGPSVGAPMAVMTLEKLIALGCRKVVVLGWCGALNPMLQVGDIFLPTWGRSEEGVSAHYPLTREAESNVPLRSALGASLTAAGLQVNEGPIWTTDAPYRELPSTIKKMASAGILAVDMEFSALCTVAAFHDIELAAVMLVSDELYHQNWQPGFTGKNFKKKSRVLFERLASLLADL